MPTVTEKAPNVMTQELANVRAFNKMMDEKSLGSGGVHAANASFKSQLSDRQDSSGLIFDGSAQARAQEAYFQEEMKGLNKSAMGSIVDGKEIDEQFKFFTDLLVEMYKDPDPEKETDHAKNIQTMVALMTAGEQAQLNRLTKEQNALIRHSNRIATEQRIGMKAQYQDVFFEVAEGQTSVPIYYRLGRDAAHGKVTIRDNQGVVLREIPLPSNKKGDHQLTWDLLMTNGQKAPTGVYFIDFEAIDKDKKSVENVVELEGVISDVDTGEDGYPEYYISGIKIDGKISKVSKNDADTRQISNYLKEIRDAGGVAAKTEPLAAVAPSPLPVPQGPQVAFEHNPITPPRMAMPAGEDDLGTAFSEVAAELDATLSPSNIDLHA